ncbi:hypothetical protein HDU87_004992 [Geranomyces variabilis]|uniref:Uncharacterized protein n=1 Tax=Geranomyces variabilis TaxID=109894 RepID=A0AAD5XTB5_9FUNG|nr:hypothetical protein HDU87_004992 [Geranomyces variabilis]
MQACGAASDREAARLRDLITYMDRHKRPLMMPASAKRGAPVDEEIADGSTNVSRKRIASPAATSGIGSTTIGGFGSGPGPALPVASAGVANVLPTAGPPYHLPPPRSSQPTQAHYALYHGQPTEPPTQLMPPHPQFAQPDPPAIGHPPPPPPPLVGGGAFSAYGAQAQQSQQQQHPHHHHQPSYINPSQQQHPPPPPILPAHPSQLHHLAHPAPYSHQYPYSDPPHGHQLPPPHRSPYTQLPQQQQQQPPPPQQQQQQQQQHSQQQQPVAGDDPYTSRVVRDLQDACAQLRFENRDLRQEVASLHHEVHVTRQQAEMYKRRWEEQLPAAALSPPTAPIAPHDAAAVVVDRHSHYQAAAAVAAEERRPSTPQLRSQYLALPPPSAGPPCGGGGGGGGGGAAGAGAGAAPPITSSSSSPNPQLHHRSDHRLEALLSKHAPPVHELLADAMRRSLYELHHEITTAAAAAADPPPPPRPPQPPPNLIPKPPPHPNGKG